jgi:hypothetical protein
MKGIFLTEQSKKEIEDKINELEERERNSPLHDFVRLGKISQLKEVLEFAIVLPVKNDWNRATDEVWGSGSWEQCYPNGVIIEKPTP